MPYRFNISTIDEEENPYPDNSDFGDVQDITENENTSNGEEDYRDAMNICDYCFGIGDWCYYCNGTGSVKRKY